MNLSPLRGSSHPTDVVSALVFPLRGLTVFVTSFPGAHAPGYESVAASRLIAPDRRRFCVGLSASRLDGFLSRPFLGLTPQAIDLSPLRGSSHPISVLSVVVPIHWGSSHPTAALSRRSVVPAWTVVSRHLAAPRITAAERRRRDRFIAWGVCPRNTRDKIRSSAEGATDRSARCRRPEGEKPDP